MPEAKGLSNSRFTIDDSRHKTKIMKLIFLFITLLGIFLTNSSREVQRKPPVKQQEVASFEMVPSSLLFQF